MTYKTFTVETLTPHIGAVINGLNLAEPLSNEQTIELHQAWLDWQVLVFRDQHLNRDQHKAFGRQFGRLHVHPLQHSYGGDPEILTVKTTADTKYTAGDAWHTDVSCEATPPIGSALYITETPECGGGDTLFADTYLAYELLSDTMKSVLGTLTAVHDGALPYIGSYGISAPTGIDYPKNEHPVIVTHPETGRKVLFVNSGFTSHILGMRAWESKSLLDGLFKHIATTPKLWCRVEWQPNTLTLWDNRCTQHHSVWDYYPHSRYGERVSILDDRRPAA